MNRVTTPLLFYMSPGFALPRVLHVRVLPYLTFAYPDSALPYLPLPSTLSLVGDL